MINSAGIQTNKSPWNDTTNNKKSITTSWNWRMPSSQHKPQTVLHLSFLICQLFLFLHKTKTNPTKSKQSHIIVITAVVIVIVMSLLRFTHWFLCHLLGHSQNKILVLLFRSSFVQSCHTGRCCCCCDWRWLWINNTANLAGQQQGERSCQLVMNVLVDNFAHKTDVRLFVVQLLGCLFVFLKCCLFPKLQGCCTKICSVKLTNWAWVLFSFFADIWELNQKKGMWVFCWTSETICTSPFAPTFSVSSVTLPACLQANQQTIFATSQQMRTKPNKIRNEKQNEKANYSEKLSILHKQNNMTFSFFFWSEAGCFVPIQKYIQKAYNNWINILISWTVLFCGDILPSCCVFALCDHWPNMHVWLLVKVWHFNLRNLGIPKLLGAGAMLGRECLHCQSPSETWAPFPTSSRLSISWIWDQICWVEQTMTHFYRPFLLQLVAVLVFIILFWAELCGHKPIHPHHLWGHSCVKPNKLVFLCVRTKCEDISVSKQK